MQEEGVIKYDQSNFTFTPPLPRHEYATVETYRKMLNNLDMIGAYEGGVGFGNISLRKDYSRFHLSDRPQFIITGTQTGHLPDLGGEHYTRVVDFDIDAFSVMGQGAIRASSETVTHAAIYMINPSIQAVIHIHHMEIWKGMIKAGYPATSKWIPYGTYEMATAVNDCIQDKTQGIFVMKGHEEGAIAYGPNISTAMHCIAAVYKEYADPRFSL